MLLLLLALHHAAARDLPKQTNHVIKYIDQCPDVGYFFKKDLPLPNSNRPGICHLCFCKDNNTAICWERANKRCDAEHFHHHGIGKREQQRSRRSPMSFSDIFVRDATRDVFNKQTPEQCKPHEASYSEGCPPADWCVGCTVCDCNVNGRWDCHLLSFCTEEDKKKRKKVNRGRTYVQKSFDKEKGTPPPARTKEEHAQREVQRLAQLISKIGDKQARQLMGQIPKNHHKRERKQKRAKNSLAYDPVKLNKTEIKHSQREKTRAGKTHLKIISDLRKQKVQQEKVKNKVHMNNVEVFNKAHLKRSPKVVTPAKKNNGKIPSTLEAEKQSILEAIKLSNIETKKQIKKEPKKQMKVPTKKQFNAQERKQLREESRKRMKVDPKKQLSIKPKNGKAPVRKAQQPTRGQVKAKRTKTTKQTTTTTQPKTTVKPKKFKRKAHKRRAAEVPQIDRKRLLHDIQQKFQLKIMDEVNRFVSEQSKQTSKIKRSAPLFKKVDIKKNTDDNMNNTKLKGISKAVKRSSKISIEKSNKVKIHRSRRSISNYDTVVTKSSVENDISTDSLSFLPKITSRSLIPITESTGNYFKHMYSIYGTKTTHGDNNFTEVKHSKNATIKRSVNSQTEVMTNLSVIKLPAEESIEKATHDFKESKDLSGVTENKAQNTKIRDPSTTASRNNFVINNTYLKDNLPAEESIEKATHDFKESKDLSGVTENTAQNTKIRDPSTTASRNNFVINNTYLKDNHILKDKISNNTLIQNFITETTVPKMMKSLLELNKTFLDLPTTKSVNNFVINITDFYIDTTLKEIEINNTNKQDVFTTIAANETDLTPKNIHFITTDKVFDINMEHVHNIENTKKISDENNISQTQAPKTILKNSDYLKVISQEKRILTTEKIVEEKTYAPYSLTKTTTTTTVKTPSKNKINSIFSSQDVENVTKLSSVLAKSGVESSNDNRWISKAILVDNESFDTYVFGKKIPESTTKEFVPNGEHIRIDDIITMDEAYHKLLTTQNDTKMNTQSSIDESITIIRINKSNTPQNISNFIEQPIVSVTTENYAQKKSQNNTITVDDLKFRENRTELLKLLSKSDNYKIDNDTTVNKETYVNKNIRINQSTIQYDDSLRVLPTENYKKNTVTVSENGMTTINNSTLANSDVEKIIKYQINNKSTKQKTKKHKKGRKHSKHRTNATETNKESLTNQQYLKLKHKIDNHFVIVLKKDNETLTSTPNIEALNTVDNNEFTNRFYEKIPKKQNITKLYLEKDLSTEGFDFEYKVRPITPAPTRKVNTYDIKKINLAHRRHKIKKLVTTLYNKTNKDERYYVNNINYENTKNNTRFSDMKSLFKKLLGGFSSGKDSKKQPRANRSKIIKYLQKFFKKIFSLGNHRLSLNQTEIPQLNRRNVVETLCATFGPCNINIENKVKLQSQIDHLNSETYHMLRSIKIIKGLLKLIHFAKSDKDQDETKNHTSRFKSDVQKLHAILRDTYVDKEHLSNLTDTQKTQIEHVKNTTQAFIQSAAKFTRVLNGIINIITVGDHKSKEEYHKINKDKIEKRFIAPESNTAKTEPEKPLWKLKELITKYNVVQNTLMKKIYKVLSNLDNKDGRKKGKRIIEPSKEIVQNKTEAIQVYTRNIIQNLRKLKHLAQNLEGSVRRKRDLRDDDSIEYLLMLMEYMLKQNHPLDTAPVNDGIDLIIEAIKNAPDIKPIKKKVLHQALNTYNSTTNTTTPESVELNMSKENSASDLNVISKEDNFTSSIEEPKFNTIDHSADNEKPEEGRFVDNSRREFTSSFVKEKNFKLQNEIKFTKSYLSYEPTRVSIDETTPSLIEFTPQVYMNPTIATYAEVTDTITDVNSNSNETEDVKFEPFIADLEEDVIITSSTSDTDLVTSQAPETSTIYSKIKMRNYKNEDASVSMSKSRLDWLDETYEDEIKQLKEAELNASASTSSPVKKDEGIGKKARKLSNESKLSKEISEEGRKKNEEVMLKKDMNLMNSLDYGTGKSDVDVSDSKESISDDKYSSDTFSTYR